jgi:hypothetical protein
MSQPKEIKDQSKSKYLIVSASLRPHDRMKIFYFGLEYFFQWKALLSELGPSSLYIALNKYKFCPHFQKISHCKNFLGIERMVPLTYVLTLYNYNVSIPNAKP